MPRIQKDIGTEETYVNAHGKARAILFAGDVEVMRAALACYKEQLDQALRNGGTEKERERMNQDRDGCTDIDQNLEWIQKDEMQHLIQVDLGQRSYTAPFK